MANAKTFENEIQPHFMSKGYRTVIDSEVSGYYFVNQDGVKASKTELVGSREYPPYCLIDLDENGDVVAVEVRLPDGVKATQLERPANEND